MGSTSTVYDVKVKYALDDKASSGVKSIGSAADKAASSAFSLKGALAAVGGVALLKGAKSALIDFNSEIDQMKIGLGAVMQMQLKMPFEKARVEADKLFKTFQEMAKKSPATTKDFMEMGNAIAPVVAMMGGGTDKIAKLAQGGILASQAFGERADVTALDIKQMLMGTVSSKDRIAQQLIASQGMTSEKFNALSGGKRGMLVEKMLQDPALLNAADQMGASFAGQVSTFKDQLQMAIGQVGLPLMQALTAEVKRWNTWIEKHPRTIKEWATSFGNGLKSAFEMVKSAASWLVEHKDLIFSLGKVVLAFKGAQMAGNVFKSFTDGVQSLTSVLQKGSMSLGNLLNGAGAGGLGSIFTKLAGSAGVLGGAFTMLTAGVTAAAYLIHKNAEVERKAQDNRVTIKEALGHLSEIKDKRDAVEKNLASARDPDAIMRLKTERDSLNAQLYSPENLGLALRKVNEFSEKEGGVSLKSLSNDTTGLLNPRLLAMLPDTFTRNPKDAKVMDDLSKMVTQFQSLRSDLREDVLKYAFPDQYGMPTPTESKAPDSEWKDLTKPEVNVTIQRVEVASEDPDRFVFGLAKLAEQAVKHRTQSHHATAGGL